MTTATPEAPDIDLMAGTLTITLTSPRTGDTRTFRVESPARGHRLCGTRTVSLMVGPGRFEAFGFATPAGVYTWSTRRGPAGHPSMFEKYSDMLNRIGYWSSRGVEYQVH